MSCCWEHTLTLLWRALYVEGCLPGQFFYFRLGGLDLSCPGDTEAQGPAARAARSRLQLRLHAHACSSHYTLNVQQACCTLRDPFRDEISEVGRGLSLADTQTGQYVRLYSRRRLCTRCRAAAESSFDLVELVRLRCSKTFFQNTIVLLSLQLSPWSKCL